MLVFLVLPAVVLLVLVFSLPIWKHPKKWSFYSIGGISLIILIVLILFWTGHL
jgi:hypothetical protein